MRSHKCGREGQIHTKNIKKSSSKPNKIKRNFNDPKPNQTKLCVHSQIDAVECVCVVNGNVCITDECTSLTQRINIETLTEFGFGSMNFSLVFFGVELDFSVLIRPSVDVSSFSDLIHLH